MLGLSVVLGLAVTGLAACDMPMYPPALMSINVAGGAPTVASCDTESIAFRFVKVYPRFDDRDALGGEADVVPGAIVAPGETFDLTGLPFDPPLVIDPRGGDEISVALFATDDTSGPRVEGVFDIPDAGLAADQWLHDDGAVTNMPC